MEIINTYITVMFSGFFFFFCCLIVLFIVASVFQFVFEKTLEFIQIVFRGHPPAPTNYYTEEKSKET
jgi:hypothetical protein